MQKQVQFIVQVWSEALPSPFLLLKEVDDGVASPHSLELVQIAYSTSPLFSSTVQFAPEEKVSYIGLFSFRNEVRRSTQTYDF